MRKMIKLSTYAKLNDCTYRTAWNRFNKGTITGEKDTSTGTIRVYYDEVNDKKAKENRCVIYTRVSSNDRKGQLETQLERLEGYSISNGYKIIKSIKEVASGMNEKRPKLNKILNSSDYDTLIIENKDRLTRFGFKYIEMLLNNKGINIVVVNDSKDDKEDLIKDFVSIITSFCGRIYGNRNSKKNKILDVIS